MAKFLKILIALLIVVGLLYWFYARGGPQPMETVEEPVAIPAASGAVE